MLLHRLGPAAASVPQAWRANSRQRRVLCRNQPPSPWQQVNALDEGREAQEQLSNNIQEQVLSFSEHHMLLVQHRSLPATAWMAYSGHTCVLHAQLDVDRTGELLLWVWESMLGVRGARPAAASAPAAAAETANQSTEASTEPPAVSLEVATFGSGCFWCTEAVFRELKGVLRCTSGFAGGHTEQPSYKQVCTGTTNHAECVQLEFDPAIISYDQILEVFLSTHSPAVVKSQYRSLILCYTASQEQAAQRALEQHRHACIKVLQAVAEGSAAQFWPAEPRHQEYHKNNPSGSYCVRNIAPKVREVRARFAELVQRTEAEDE